LDIQPPAQDTQRPESPNPPALVAPHNPAPTPALPAPAATPAPQTFAAPQSYPDRPTQPSGLIPPLATIANPGANCRPWRVDGEYLLWFLRPMHIDAPLVNTTAPGTDLGLGSPLAGSVADPAASTLFGHADNNRSLYHGGRLTVAYDAQKQFGLGGEAIFLWIPGQANHYHIASNGTMPLTLPYFDASTNLMTGNPVGESAFPVAGLVNGGVLTGSVDVRTYTQMWGGEINATMLLYRDDHLRVDALAGVRYLGLQDDLSISTATTSPGGGSSTFDSFRVQNNFYGGQIGARGRYTFGQFWTSLSTKIAFGTTQETLDINGNAVLPGFVPAGAPQLPGGFYTAVSNLGSSRQDSFAIVSDTTLAVGWRPLDWINLGVGYNFLYWSRMMRSGDQVSHAINTNLNPALTPFATPGGAAAPARLDRETDFWGHGLSFTVEFRF
jgi:hypothetical protein